MSSRATPLYLLHPAPIEQQAKIISFRDLGEAKFAFIADKTVFYPASGGQPSDIGVIRSKSSPAEAAVERVMITNGAVEHIAFYIQGVFAEGSEIEMSVDINFRALHSRLHSAGELLCSAVHNLGHDWPVSSASHYPQQSRIVYAVALTEDERQQLRDALNAEMHRLLLRSGRVRIVEVADRAEATRLIGFSPDYVPAGEPVRIVFVDDGPGRPCCGTHVAETREIGSILIRNIRTKKGQTSISYDIIP